MKIQDVTKSTEADTPVSESPLGDTSTKPAKKINKPVSFKKPEITTEEENKIERPEKTPKKTMNTEIRETPPTNYKKMGSYTDDQGEFQLYRTDETKTTNTPTCPDDTEGFNFFNNLFERFGCWIYIIFGILIGLLGIMIMFIKRRCFPAPSE